jgi:hypothetical protein
MINCQQAGNMDLNDWLKGHEFVSHVGLPVGWLKPSLWHWDTRWKPRESVPYRWDHCDLDLRQGNHRRSPYFTIAVVTQHSLVQIPSNQAIEQLHQLRPHNYHYTMLIDTIRSLRFRPWQPWAYKPEPDV